MPLRPPPPPPPDSPPGDRPSNQPATSTAQPHVVPQPPALMAVTPYTRTSRMASPGTRLGSYEIIASHRRRRHGRGVSRPRRQARSRVALKILPDAFVSDADRLARFRREAQVLASLNHPNIAGSMASKKSATTHALVLELVEGETLAGPHRRRADPAGRGVPIAQQIAEALEAAHEPGIVHRDLKPANIKVPRRRHGEGARLRSGESLRLRPDRGAGCGWGEGRAADAMNSPTLTTPAMTQAGMILGTAAYMAPEQARGRRVDRRADVWAFGAVLYEMLTGARAFPGDDLTDTLAAVVRAEPDWTRLPADLPSDARDLPEAVPAEGPETACSRHRDHAPCDRGRVRRGRTAHHDVDCGESVAALGTDRGGDRGRVTGRCRLRTVEPTSGRAGNVGSPDDPAASGRGDHILSRHHRRWPDGGLHRATRDRRSAALPARSQSD